MREKPAAEWERYIAGKCKAKQSPAAGNAAEYRKRVKSRGYHRMEELMALPEKARKVILNEEFGAKGWAGVKPKRKSPAKVGAEAEARVAAKCEEYRRRGIADIRRFPTETRTIHQDGKSISVRTREGQWCDFIGYWLRAPYPSGTTASCTARNGRHIHVEVKATTTFRLAIESEEHYAKRLLREKKTGKMPNFAGLSWTQLQALDDADRAECTALLVWVVGDRMAAISPPWATVANKSFDRIMFESCEVQRGDFLRVEQ